MKIIDFTYKQREEAAELALSAYEEERRHVPSLPPQTSVPDLTAFADNGLGVAAYENGRMTGFLCGCSPFDHAFGSTDAKGIFSPMGANAAVSDQHDRIYAAMYQAAGAKWVGAGAASHAVCLYAHDEAAQYQFFRYGFGMRCADAIRSADHVPPVSSSRTAEDMTDPCMDITFFEPGPDEIHTVLPLHTRLVQSYQDSPFFMLRQPECLSDITESIRQSHPLYFAARHEHQVIAFIRAEVSGETFIQDTPGYLHITGAYCLPEYRRTGVSSLLLSRLLKKMQTLGLRHLGVDYESINASGSGFWNKHFTAYTHGVVRRIDEHILYKMRR